MVIAFIVSVILLLAVTGVVVPAGTLGKFERKRREGRHTNLEVERELFYAEVLSIQRVLEALLIVTTAALSVASFGWLVGLVVALLIALEHGAIARLPILRSRLSRLYEKRLEAKLLAFIQAHPGAVRYIKVFMPESPEIQLHSQEELRHLIETSSGIVTNDEKKLLLGGLDFSNKLVREVMTPRSMVDSINKVELLGPLVLDDLHKKGHSRFPVIETDVDHVVGILHLRDVLRVDTSKKHTPKVETVMEKRVYYIHEDQTLNHALTAFIKTHHHLFIVVNEYRETVGLLSLEDVIEALIGREIVDEFDTHDDLRAVAARNPRANNQSAGGRDL